MKIFIAGASRGIGLFLMEKFSNKGIEVYGTYNSTTPPQKYDSKLTKVDVTDHKQVSDWITKNVGDGDQLILVNCAGTNYNAFAHKADAMLWRDVIDVNLIGTFNLINTMLPYMRENGFGRIINFGSIVAQKGIPGTSAYAASKSALWGMAKSIAAENARKGITINNLNLGYFDIGMISDVPENILENIKKTIPSQQLGSPENIFNAIWFIITSEYINGSSLDINGGLY